MFDRRVFAEVGYYDESLHIEDWDMYLRMSAHDLLGFLDTPVAAYRSHAANSIQQYVDESPARRIAHMKYQKRVLENNRAHFRGDDLKFVRKKIRKLNWKIVKTAARGFFGASRAG